MCTIISPLRLQSYVFRILRALYVRLNTNKTAFRNPILPFEHDNKEEFKFSWIATICLYTTVIWTNRPVKKHKLEFSLEDKSETTHSLYVPLTTRFFDTSSFFSASILFEGHYSYIGNVILSFYGLFAS